MSYDSDFEKLEDELRRKLKESDDRAGLRRTNELVQRYWDAKAAVKRAGDLKAVGKASCSPEPVVDAPLQEFIFVEVCCGSGRMASESQRHGFSPIGIDYKGNKDKPQCSYVELDLTTPHGQREAWKILLQPAVVAVMLDPPCGTASRAREIRRRSGPDPKPLRSETFPDGLPSLSGLAKHK
eukprot:7383097-Karenia_brevis.AAC.1